jgi:2,4-dienoyl-CoA reductase (NADPH2)
LNRRADVRALSDIKAKEVVVASGVTPRMLKLEGAERPEVVSYIDVLQGQVELGNCVAIIGAGGIGFDIADFISHDQDDALGFYKSWGIDTQLNARGGIMSPGDRTSRREIHMFQRSSGKMGAGLGKTTGWIHRQTLKHRGIQFHSGVRYELINNEGLIFQDAQRNQQCMRFDHIIVCAGQLPNQALYNELQMSGDWKVHLIGGAKEARDLDAERAIMEGYQLGRRL